MDERAVPLSEVQEIPRKSLILVAGAPGAGKSDFCHQVVLNRLAMDRPVIFVTTEQGPTEIAARLQEKGLGGLPPGALTPAEVGSLLAGNGVDGTTVSEIVDFLERCDTVRYAASAADALSPSQAAGKVRGWISSIEGGPR